MATQRRSQKGEGAGRGGTITGRVAPPGVRGHLRPTVTPSTLSATEPTLEGPVVDGGVRVWNLRQNLAQRAAPLEGVLAYGDDRRRNVENDQRLAPLESMAADGDDRRGNRDAGHLFLVHSPFFPGVEP